MYDAREHAIGLIKREAEAIGADDVVGVKTHIHELGGLIEFMAIGTAVKRVPGIATVTPTLPPQAIIKDKDTWISRDDNLFAAVGTSKGDHSPEGDFARRQHARCQSGRSPAYRRHQPRAWAARTQTSLQFGAGSGGMGRAAGAGGRPGVKMG